MTTEDVRWAVKPKSDQLNADDLIGGPMTVTVQQVRSSGSTDQPIIIDIGAGLQPYKPCKSMLRLMIFCWGKNGNDWVGKSMTLYNDPKVKWADVEIGGIRISHISDIDQPVSLALTQTRRKRAPYQVQPLKLPEYSQAQFDKNFPAWQKAVTSGSMTPQDVISKAQQKGLLSAAMKQAVLDCAVSNTPETQPAAGDDLPEL